MGGIERKNRGVVKKGEIRRKNLSPSLLTDV